jgi:hypothetical protein
VSGSAARSQALHHEALLLCRDLGDMPGLAKSLNGLALLAQSNGQLKDAARLFAAADVLRREFQCALPAAESRDRNMGIHALSNELGDTAFDALGRAGLTMSAAEAVSCAMTQQTAI